MNRCACRDCMELSAGQPGTVCHDCEDAGCFVFVANRPTREAPYFECQREDFGLETSS